VLILTASLTAVRLFSRHLHSYHCVCTSDPEQTVRQIAALQPRGVIIDVAQGPEAVERVGRAVAETAIPSIPVITCQMPSESPAPILAHVGGYLTKPVTRQDLLDALRTLGREVETVLVVDDAEDVLRVFTHYLQDDPTRPHRVMSARNGCEALQLMRREPPDLVLLDLVMPVLDGYQVLEEMQRSHELADIPVILVTGQDAQVEHAAMVGRMEAWMPKGMSVDQLLRGTNDLIRALLGATPAPSPAEGEASP
jgi:CheY-like chemotaxis protein